MSVILLSLSAYWFISLGIHVVLRRMSFCIQIWKISSAIFCRCGFLLPFSIMVVELKLSVLISTASCWICCENDFKQDFIAKSSLDVELVSFCASVNLPWHMLFPSRFRIYPPYECPLASVNMICEVG